MLRDAVKYNKMFPCTENTNQAKYNYTLFTKKELVLIEKLLIILHKSFYS